MTVRPERLERLLTQAGKPLGLKEIMRAGGFHPGEQTDLKRALRDLVRQGALRQEGQRFQAASAPRKPERPRPHPGQPKGPARGVVEGVLHVHPDGFGFVHPRDETRENIYLPPDQAARALDGDRVSVEEIPSSGGRTQGRLVRVVERLRREAVGTYRERGHEALVEPNDRDLTAIRVPKTQLARDGDVVKVLLGVGSGMVAAGRGLVGEVTGSLGKPGEPSAEVLSIAYAKGFSDEFPPAVMAEADAIALAVSPAEAAGEGRVDLRSLPLVTIDGADARDFDDAVYAEPKPGGWRLVVAIADVSHYVRESSALDGEALRRATSVYLPDRVLPMLPERLSAGICSLKPEEDRLCMVADMHLDASGALGPYTLYPAVMRSHARCTYEEVQAVLDGHGAPNRVPFRAQFATLLTVSRALTEMRRKRGAIDFDLPESRTVLDETGRPLRMERRERKDSHRLIEECMLAANEAVAKYFQSRQLPSVYRFHGEPDEEKLAAFSAMAQAHGFKVGFTSHELNAFLEQLEGHPEERALNQLLLRSMMQAVYSAENIGHYGLAAEHYLHFTSPIRRYPDLLVHRLLKRAWANGGRPMRAADKEAETERLEALAVASSERERAAMQVEREVVSFYATLLMKDRVGEVFDATVSSVTDFGFFVELTGLFVEGLVKGEGKLDPVLHQLIFRDGRKVRVGQAMRVRLVSANVARRQLDFELEGRPAALGPAPAPATRRDGKRAPDQERSGSAHPGFDRLRALAQRKGGGGQAAPKRRGHKRR